MIAAYEHFVGIDWGTENHEICVLDAAGAVVEKRRIANTGAGLQALVALCRARGAVAVGIETPRGALVETLLHADVHVFHINPKQAERFRERYTAAGAKDDRLDAYAIGRALRTDIECFRRVEVTPDHLVELQTLSRLDDTLTGDRVRMQNRLREVVLLVRPALLALCNGADEPWFWDVLEKAIGSPRAMTASQIAPFLRQHRIRRVTAEDVLKALHEEGTQVSPGTLRAANAGVRTTVSLLRGIHQQQRAIAKQLAALLDQLAKETDEGQSSEHRDVAVLRSMPGAGDKTVAAMLAEVPQFLRTRDYRALRAITGVAPVTDATGKRSRSRATVKMRRGCRNRLRTVMYWWAMNTLRVEAWKALYDRMRARGLNHNASLRSLGDRLLRVLIGALKRGLRYDPGILGPPPGTAVA